VVSPVARAGSARFADGLANACDERRRIDGGCGSASLQAAARPMIPVLRVPLQFPERGCRGEGRAGAGKCARRDLAKPYCQAEGQKENPCSAGWHLHDAFGAVGDDLVELLQRSGRWQRPLPFGRKDGR